jgi:hypothetical protein
MQACQDSDGGVGVVNSGPFKIFFPNNHLINKKYFSFSGKAKDSAIFAF